MANFIRAETFNKIFTLLTLNCVNLHNKLIGLEIVFGNMKTIGFCIAIESILGGFFHM